jgi:hypothetical protein
MATGTRKTGEFCWINMLTPQPAEARAFFGTLLGLGHLAGRQHLLRLHDGTLAVHPFRRR